MELHQVGDWLVVMALLVAILLFLKFRIGDDRPPSKWRSRLDAWAADRFTSAPEVDQLADDLSRFLRRERLRADVQRLQRIIATDMAMSATRQLGNRMAYHSLLSELEAIRDIGQPHFTEGFMDNWNVSEMPAQTTRWMSSQDSSRPPKVEILEIRWKG